MKIITHFLEVVLEADACEVFGGNDSPEFCKLLPEQLEPIAKLVGLLGLSG